MRAYYFDNLPGDQRLPHSYDPPRPVSVETLEKINVKYWFIPLEGHLEEVNKIADERGYKNKDTINVSKEGLGEVYEEKIKNFFQEHMHEDEEIRYILDGSGFFDVRESPSDEWVRIVVEPGDLIVLPAGIYHRFTLDEKNMIKAIRLFQDEPKWVPYNRSHDTEKNPYRTDYLKTIGVGA
ncbi:Acireductone dioxygenase ARD family [Cyathus striatus]|nr:Acireductone dioxygenase ARD family [Cyathus striatus]